MIIDSQCLTRREDGQILPQAANPMCRIFVYQRNVERAAGTVEQLEDEVVAAPSSARSPRCSSSRTRPRRKKHVT